MRIYTVHEPPERRREEKRGPDRFVFVRDGFHFWALVSAPLWLIFHGLWLALLGYVVVAAGLSAVLRASGIASEAAFLVFLLLGILVALEASTLRRWTLARNGWRQLGVVAAPDYETAERRFFDAWDGGAEEPAAGHTPGRAAYRAHGSDVLGLFPEPGGTR